MAASIGVNIPIIMTWPSGIAAVAFFQFVPSDHATIIHKEGPFSNQPNAGITIGEAPSQLRTTKVLPAVSSGRDVPNMGTFRLISTQK